MLACTQNCMVCLALQSLIFVWHTFKVKNQPPHNYVVMELSLTSSHNQLIQLVPSKVKQVWLYMCTFVLPSCSQLRQFYQERLKLDREILFQPHVIWLASCLTDNFFTGIINGQLFIKVNDDIMGGLAAILSVTIARSKSRKFTLQSVL